MTTTATPPGLLDLTIDGQSVRVPAGTTVFDAARINGIAIPTLCHLQNETPVGVCRLCVVEAGGRVLSASCVRPAEAGMKILTNSEKVLASRKTLIEVLMADSTCISCGECMVSCPTGALTNKSVVGTTIAAGPGAQGLEAEELHRLPVFQGVSGTFLELNRGAIVKRTFRAGELICREGDFGSTAFYIVEGQARVSISTPIAHVKTQGGAQGFFKRLTSTLAPREEHKRDGETRDRNIPIDASVDLSYENPVAALGPGDLFGEMTCMNFYPRSATVRAETHVVAYEMLRNVLDIMMKNKSFRSQIDQNYRRRALENHLRGVPMFADLAPDFIAHLKESVELQRFAPGQVICRQGDPADSSNLVPIAFGKVSENYPGGELVLAFPPRADYFGEIGLLGGGLRTATCTA